MRPQDRGWRAPVLLTLILCGAGLGACSSGPKTPAAQMRAWAANASYSDDVAQLRSDFADLRNGLREQKLASLRTECEGFGVDAETLYGELPTPDETVTNELATSLTGFFDAARACYDAKSFESTSFHAYQRELRADTAIFNTATDRIAADGVK